MKKYSLTSIQGKIINYVFVHIASSVRVFYFYIQMKNKSKQNIRGRRGEIS